MAIPSPFEIYYEKARERFILITEEAEAARLAFVFLNRVLPEHRDESWEKRLEVSRNTIHDLWMRWQGAKEIMDCFAKLEVINDS